MTLPEDKKDFVKKEVKAVQEKLEMVQRFQEKVAKIEAFVTKLNEFDGSIKSMDKWMKDANTQLSDIKNASDKMTQDAQDYKDELKRVRDYILDLQKRVKQECDNFSEDVKYWAEYKTGIKSFRPWLESAESKSGDGLAKPQTLDEANGMYATVNDFAKACTSHLEILTLAEAAANRMTPHKEADSEVAELKGRYEKVKGISDEWCKKVDTLVKEWKLLDTTVNELNSWVAQDRNAA